MFPIYLYLQPPLGSMCLVAADAVAVWCSLVQRFNHYFFCHYRAVSLKFLVMSVVFSLAQEHLHGRPGRFFKRRYGLIASIMIIYFKRAY
jgi:hypothetical protein